MMFSLAKAFSTAGGNQTLRHKVTLGQQASAGPQPLKHFHGGEKYVSLHDCCSLKKLTFHHTNFALVALFIESRAVLLAWGGEEHADLTAHLHTLVCAIRSPSFAAWCTQRHAGLRASNSPSP